MSIIHMRLLTLIEINLLETVELWFLIKSDKLTHEQVDK